LIKLVKDNRTKFFEDGFDIHNHNNNLLEYCIDSKYVKLWFDIDMIKIEIHIIFITKKYLINHILIH